MPARAADVAAPMRKLCPAYWCCSRPRLVRMILISPTKQNFVIVFPPVSKKNGPGLTCRPAMKLRIAATGRGGCGYIPVRHPCQPQTDQSLTSSGGSHHCGVILTVHCLISPGWRGGWDIGSGELW